MRVRIESSRIVKPLYEEGIIPPPSTTINHIPLSVFDKVTFDAHVAIIYAYRPPNPPNDTIEKGLRKALSVYREWAGRLSKDEDGESVILLNDAGVRFVEASIDIKLDQVMPLRPSAFCLSLHPSIQGNIQELVQVQITRFTCGSIVVGFTAHHAVADGHATSNFLVAWGQACRSLEIHPLPLQHRGIFNPRVPPRVEFQHRGVEFKNQKLETRFQFSTLLDKNVEGVAVDQFHFSLGFLAKLKSKASSKNGNNKPYSTFESLMAHLWKSVTKARGLSAYQTTSVRISVNGRMRMKPRIPNEYFGNLVLWALPTSKVKDLLSQPVAYGAKLIHDAVANVNDGYFRSFIDFASHKVKEENLVPVADMNQIEFPNLDVNSWLRFPFYEVDFGCGPPHVFMPSYFPLEGTIFLIPSFIGDGSIDAVVALFEDHLAAFKQSCYELDS